MDFTMVTRTGRKAWAIAVFSLLTPMFLGVIMLNKYDSTLKATIGDNTGDLHVVVIAHSSCSFVVIAAFLTDLKILNSEIGRLATSTALVSDVLSSVVQALGTSVTNGISQNNLVLNLLCLCLLLIIPPLVCRPAMLWIVKNTPEGRPVKKIYVDVIILSIFLLGFVGRYSNQPFFAGAYVLGIVVPEGPPLGSALVNRLDFFVNWFFLPIFVTTCVMKLDITNEYSTKLLVVTGCILILVYLMKMLICVGISLYCKMPTKDAVCLAVILSCKGVVDVNSFILLFDARKLKQQMGSLMVLSVLIIASVVRISVKQLYDPSRKYGGYQKRNIMKLKHNSELAIVACVHIPSNISAIQNVLDLCCPTINHPIAVNVLHLIELVGRTSPIFISHSLQEKVMAGHYNYSGDILVKFDLFQLDRDGAAKVDIYTAISPTSLMHEDVCFLALDKLASIIFLPFHVRWGADGSVESRDNNIRALNCRVLEKVPCSIAILVSRGIHPINSSNDHHDAHTSKTQIAMIFFGGMDDREALCLAKRAASGPNVVLIVYHVMSSDYVKPTSWDRMLDDDVLKDVREPRFQNVVYEEVEIDDPSQTTSFIMEIAARFEFIIVGRNYGVKTPQTAGLQTWSDFPELGVVGDMLASSDLDTRASILVVQQQKMLKSGGRL
ncbi:hypothetical protein L6164_001571 [Bauhinia variegata]|uniref:Uncharacterized protein n=1 Tax=Bauhinia variegata TaxID=167791 RepID=A0ACB9QC74_BAUVA|nr:hypothetical protein L6164_001571 [Bauhinia variegata]